MKYILKPLLFICMITAIAILNSGCSGTSSKSTVELLQTGTFLAKEGKWKKAYDYAYAAAKKEPTNISAQILLALTGEQIKKMPQALDAARKAVQINPDNFMAQYTLGRLYAKDSKTRQEAIEPLRIAQELNPRDVSVLLLRADVYFQLNSLDYAVNCYNEIITKHPNFLQSKINKAAIYNQLAVIYTKSNMDTHAAQCIKYAYNMAPDNPHILLNFGVFWEHIKRNERSIAYYKKYLEVTSQNKELADKHKKVNARIAKLSGQ